MPRTARADRAGFHYHVMNRGNAKARVFHDADDYDAFVGIVRQASARHPMLLLAWCLMPNHVHFVVQPYADGGLGAWMHWMLTTHVTRHRRRYDTTGRIWQGRYKACPIQDIHLLTVIRYVERNPLRASLVREAQDWRWSSLRGRWTAEAPLPLDPLPVPAPENWLAWVQEPLTEGELGAVRKSVRGQTPYGDEFWTRTTSERLGVRSGLPPLRPVERLSRATRNVPIQQIEQAKECP